MKETGLTGKRRSTTIAATPDDGNSQRKRRRRRAIHDGNWILPSIRVVDSQICVFDTLGVDWFQCGRLTLVVICYS